MVQFVTLQEVSDHLRLDLGEGDDADLTLKIQAASEAVMEYLKWEEVPETIPARVKAATLNLIGSMYLERDGELAGPVQNQFGQGQLGYGYLPVGVVALLYPMRKPSLA